MNEPNVLTPKRTEYGKAIRKAYESGEIQESRHNMTEMTPRTDGIANTLTTVLKDNYIAEPINAMPDGTCRTLKNQYYKTSVANFERSSTFGATGVQNGLRIRKLTPKECFRLMGFDDSDFEKAEAVNSNTQLYKQAGNSIVVPVVEYIISALFDCGALVKEKEKKEMELKINELKLPEQITFNYEELKQELTERVSMYETLVYTDETIKDAKADRANLNKLKKALNDERIRMEKEYMVPFNSFKSQVNEIISIIDKPVAVIDAQVKEYEENQKQEKLDEIINFFNSTEHPEWLHFSQVLNEKWLNASVSMKSVQDSIIAGLEKIKTDIATLSNLPEFGFEATKIYESTLDINQALAEGQRMSQIAKAKAEQEAEQARLKAEAETKAAEPQPQPAQEGFMNPPVDPEPQKQWISFKALLTTDDALALKVFFESRNIEFKAI